MTHKIETLSAAELMAVSDKATRGEQYDLIRIAEVGQVIRGITKVRLGTLKQRVAKQCEANPRKLHRGMFAVIEDSNTGTGFFLIACVKTYAEAKATHKPRGRRGGRKPESEKAPESTAAAPVEAAPKRGRPRKQAA